MVVAVVAVASVVAACSGHEVIEVVPDAGFEVAPFAMDVTVSPTTVTVYTGGADMLPCTCTTWAFPPPGACVIYDDGLTCMDASGSVARCPSCLTRIELQSGGVTIASSTVLASTGLDTLEYPTPPSADLTLVISGCGHADAIVDLGGHAFPTPMVAASYISNVGTDVSWSTDLAAPTVYAAQDFGIVTGVCHVADVQQTILPELVGNRPASDGVWIQTFAPSAAFPTPQGNVTVWWGGTASTPVAPASP